MRYILLSLGLLSIGLSDAFAQQQSAPTVQDQLYAVCVQTNMHFAKMLDVNAAELSKAKDRIVELEKAQADAAAKTKQEEKK